MITSLLYSCFTWLMVLLIVTLSHTLLWKFVSPSGMWLFISYLFSERILRLSVRGQPYYQDGMGIGALLLLESPNCLGGVGIS